MNVIQTGLRDCVVIEPNVFSDERGFFLETFHAGRYADIAGIDIPFPQDNHSRSYKGVLRGLHFQKTRPQGKLVRVVSGEVYDVAVDIRRIHKPSGVGMASYYLSTTSGNSGCHRVLLMDSWFYLRSQILNISARITTILVMRGVSFGTTPILTSNGQ
jgi:hypothetical protein